MFNQRLMNIHCKHRRMALMALNDIGCTTNYVGILVNECEVVYRGLVLNVYKERQRKRRAGLLTSVTTE